MNIRAEDIFATQRFARALQQVSQMKTLAEEMKNERVPVEIIETRCRAVVKIQRILIGFVPHCANYFEIWPLGFYTHNLIMPNFLNLPGMIFAKNDLKEMVSLAAYNASRIAGCRYSVAHSAAFAFRRGASLNTVRGERHDMREEVVAEFAASLASDPCCYSAALQDEVLRFFSPEEVEAIVLGVGAMGFLNKFAEALGVGLEEEMIEYAVPIVGELGWSAGKHDWALKRDVKNTKGKFPKVDSFFTCIKIIPCIPGLIAFDRNLKAGLPKDPEKAREFVAENFYFDEPLIEAITSTRARTALAAVLQKALDPDQSVAGMEAKALAGLIYAHHMQNAHLIEQNKAMARASELDDAVINGAQAIKQDVMIAGLDRRMQAIAHLGAGIAPSPSDLHEDTIKEAMDVLSTAEIVEIVIWVSVCQMIHRLSQYYQTNKA